MRYQYISKEFESEINESLSVLGKLASEVMSMMDINEPCYNELRDLLYAIEDRLGVIEKGE